jgi:hypothetical protein
VNESGHACTEKHAAMKVSPQGVTRLDFSVVGLDDGCVEAEIEEVM